MRRRSARAFSPTGKRSASGSGRPTRFPRRCSRPSTTWTKCGPLVRPHHLCAKSLNRRKRGGAAVSGVARVCSPVMAPTGRPRSSVNAFRRSHTNSIGAATVTQSRAPPSLQTGPTTGWRRLRASVPSVGPTALSCSRLLGPTSYASASSSAPSREAWKKQRSPPDTIATRSHASQGGRRPRALPRSQRN